MTWLAFDIGGANLKVADGHGMALVRPFPLWKHPEQLAERLAALLKAAPPSERLAITMTGELADCYVDRASGVNSILHAVDRSAGDRRVSVYLTDGRFVTADEARRDPLLAASSNWHALAAFACRYVSSSPALLCDIGSTTCDLIPLLDGRPVPRGRTDLDRLLSGELVYTGTQRSPVCAVLSSAPYRGERCTIAQELFATMYDVYLLLGEFPENLDDCDTADGRPATRAAARARLGRLLGADGDRFDEVDARRVAEAAAEAQCRHLAAAAEQVLQTLPAPPAQIILSGHGEFLANRLLDHLCLSAPRTSLAAQVGIEASRAAPAHALAVLAREAHVT